MDHHRAPRRQRGEQAGNEAVDVEERHDEEGPVGGGQSVGGLDILFCMYVCVGTNYK